MERPSKALNCRRTDKPDKERRDRELFCAPERTARATNRTMSARRVKQCTTWKVFHSAACALLTLPVANKRQINSSFNNWNSRRETRINGVECAHRMNYWIRISIATTINLNYWFAFVRLSLICSCIGRRLLRCVCLSVDRLCGIWLIFNPTGAPNVSITCRTQPRLSRRFE